MRLENKKFRVPGSADGFIEHVVSVAGAKGYSGKMDACVTEDVEEEKE